LPWRGNSQYVVDKVVSSQSKPAAKVAEPGIKNEEDLEQL